MTKHGLQTKRNDVLRGIDVDKLLNMLEDKTMMKGTYKTALHGKPITQSFSFNCKMIQCFIALLRLFGKRKIEPLTLRRKDVEGHKDGLYVRFIVRKRRRQYEGGIKVSHLKMIALENPYVKYVLNWITTIHDPEQYLFPGKTRNKTRRVKVKWTTRQGTKRTKICTYQDEAGHLSPQHIWKIIKFLDPTIWIHLFRRSLATIMAEKDAAMIELMGWFDWSDPGTAQAYVARTSQLTMKWSQRKW